MATENLWLPDFFKEFMEVDQPPTGPVSTVTLISDMTIIQ